MKEVLVDWMYHDPLMQWLELHHVSERILVDMVVDIVEGLIRGSRLFT